MRKFIGLLFLLFFLSGFSASAQVGGQQMRQTPQQPAKRPQVTDPKYGSGRTEKGVTVPEQEWEPGENDRRIFIIIEDNRNGDKSDKR